MSSSAINVPSAGAGGDSSPTRLMKTKDKAPLLHGHASDDHEATPSAVVRGGGGGWKKGIAIFDFILRICALVVALAASGAMGSSGETLPFFTQFFQFQAGYDDFPTFQFFVIAMAIVGGYLVLSLPFSIVTIIRPFAVGPRFLLFALDTVALTLATSAGGAGASIVYLAHNGNSNTNWLAICQQFGDFCQKVSGAVVASFISVLFLISLVILSALALRRN